MALKEKTILITRQREQAEEFITELEAHGAHAVVVPTIRITDPDSWEGCDDAIRRIGIYQCILFTSTNAVDKFFQRCLLKGVEPVVLRQCDIYAVGQKTKWNIERRGVVVSYVPEEFSSESLARYFEGRNLKGKRFLFPRGNLGSGELIRTLVRQGAIVEPVDVYNNAGPDEAGAKLLWQRLSKKELDVVTFASPSAAINFAKIISPVRMATASTNTKIAVIGPTTEEAVRNLGFKVDIVAKESTVRGLVKAITEYYE
jgi:uroporphyrinogen III methyltransferase / synthase